MRKEITLQQALSVIVHAKYIELISWLRLKFTSPKHPPPPQHNTSQQQLCVKVPEMRFEFVVP
jgi:hypothetical protein